MTRTIGIIGAFDTKGRELMFVRHQLDAAGVRSLLIDVGVFPQDSVEVDVSAETVASAGGANLDALRDSKDKTRAMVALTEGAAIVAAKLYAEGRIGGLIGMGGTAGTAIAASAMRALPIGAPKVLVSTVASGDTRPYVGTKDITMMYSVVDISGLNRISRNVLANAAGAIAGMSVVTPSLEEDRPLVAASMFGNTTACVDRARAALEVLGSEVLVFHATGSGGMTMESLIADGFFSASLDLTTTELADDLCGGVFSAGPTRLEAAGLRGIPQVVAPGCLDMVNFWARSTVPAVFADRRLYEWNSNVTLMRTTPAENAELGRRLAEKLSRATGPVTLLLPLRGLSQLAIEGQIFWWPEADQALFDAIRATAAPSVRIVELDCAINDPAFADTAAAELQALMQASEVGQTA